MSSKPTVENKHDAEWAREFISEIEDKVADRTCKGLLPEFLERLRDKLHDVRVDQWLADE